MPTLAQSYPGMIVALAERYGYGEPGPAAGEANPFAAMIAVALAEMIDARHAKLAVEALGEEDLLEPEALAAADSFELTEITKQARAALSPKAVRTLQTLARWLVKEHDGSAEALADVPTERLRDDLRGLSGIGAATADAILLFALGRPAYPVDRATYRILMRHGWLDPGAEYDEARDTVEQLGAGDATALACLSSWLERVGREACRPSVAKCDRCPLRPFLPPDGPREPE